MTYEQILQGIEHVLRTGGYDHYRDGTRWSPEDLRYNAEFFLPVVKRAVAEALAPARALIQAAKEQPGSGCPPWLTVSALEAALGAVNSPPGHRSNCPGGGPLCECGDLTTNPQPPDMSRKIPPRLAVDANGYVWRVYSDDHWSMAPVNPDNSPLPQPVTFYEPVEEPSSHLPNCPSGGPLCECGSQPDGQTVLNEVVTKVLALARDTQDGRFGQPPAVSVIVNKLREIAVRDER